MLRESASAAIDFYFCCRQKQRSGSIILRLRLLPRIQLSEPLTAVRGSRKGRTNTYFANQVCPFFKH